MDIAGIISRCQTGDMDSFEQLFRLYREKALGTAYLITGNRFNAEDIVQEAFITCFREINQLKNPESFNIWFYRLLIRVGWRMSSKWKLNIPFTDLSHLLDTDAEIDSVEKIINTIDNRLAIRNAVKKLTLPLKTVIVLYYFDEMSVKDISLVLGCFQGTVKSRLYTARKILKKELELQYDTDFNDLKGKEFGIHG